MLGDKNRNSRFWKKLTAWIPFPALRIFLLLTTACALAAGFGVTTFWFFKVVKLQPFSYLSISLPMLILGLAFTVFSSLLNIGLRWVRWHFLIRRAGARLITKESLLIYMATLPAIMTPFYIGELFRVVLLGKKYSEQRLNVVGIWLLERSSDLLVLSIFLSVIRHQMVFALSSGVVWLAVVIVIKVLYFQMRLKNFPGLFAICVLLLFSLITCCLPGTSLWIILNLLDSPLEIVSSFDVFTSSTILGNLLGLPSGVGITGSSMVMALQLYEISSLNAMFGTFVFRTGTVWFVVALGFLVFVMYRRRLQMLFQRGHTTEHFDEIAESYAEQIPSYIRERLLTRKVRLILKSLEEQGVTSHSRGIDIGCGQGWYTCEVSRFGYEMHGVDQAEQQIQRAFQYAQQQKMQINFKVIKASTLPFPDNHFDFAYAINVIHHLKNEEILRQVLQEIVRVLKPGGLFCLHEINTTNIIFKFYMGYIFPLIHMIDEGTEQWIKPNRLPVIVGARWLKKVDYFTFLPDFMPLSLMQPFEKVERWLEQSRFSAWSAHYMARLVKDS
jgi:2-polyprenyl-3-methyl-5-hydroxy-6-metoxy-1,4-benzoquinol methylase